MAKRFRFVSPGEVLVGVVMNENGKPIQNVGQLHNQQMNAIGGLSSKTNLSVHCEFTPDNAGPADLVDLRNPELKILECS